MTPALLSHCAAVEAENAELRQALAAMDDAAARERFEWTEQVAALREALALAVSIDDNCHGCIKNGSAEDEQKIRAALVGMEEP